MEIEISKDTSKKVNRASKTLGMNEKELIDRAILVYLDSRRSYLELKDELKAWDLLSDEALLDFEKSQ